MALAIKVEDLSKYYKLGVINNGRLWKDLQSYFARLANKEDPNLKIGEVYDKEGFWALSNISIEIEQGDRVAIMGYNGAGKSTLLKILSRITLPTKGCFHVKGRIASLLEVGTGFHTELTGRENIYMNGAILGMKRREITRKLDQIIDFSETGPHIDTPVKRYSSGMYVRLGFAIAAHLDCEIMIADEVLAVGDLSFQQKAIGKMKDLSANQGRTVLFVSHNPMAVEKLCNRGLMLDRGKVTLEQCPMEEAVKKYKELMGIA
jgi:lipopolysaccharide transport system ATP-binding protein